MFLLPQDELFLFTYRAGHLTWNWPCFYSSTKHANCSTERLFVNTLSPSAKMQQDLCSVRAAEKEGWSKLQFVTSPLDVAKISTLLL